MKKIILLLFVLFLAACTPVDNRELYWDYDYCDKEFEKTGECGHYCELTCDPRIDNDDTAGCVVGCIPSCIADPISCE